MRRWDGLVDGYIKKTQERGICEASTKSTASRLARWGTWLKARRPRPVLDDLDPLLHDHYLLQRSPFKAKSTIYGTLSTNAASATICCARGCGRRTRCGG